MDRTAGFEMIAARAGPVGSTDRRPSSLLCFTYLFVIQSALLFALGGSRALLVLVLGMTAGWIVAFPRPVVIDLARNAILFLYAGFALLSTAWSIYPGKTAWTAIQLVATLALSVTAASTPHRRHALTGLAAAFIVYMLISFAFGNWVGWMNREVVFTGLNYGKNLFGHVAALTGMMSLGLLAWVRQGRTAAAVGAIVLAQSMTLIGLVLSHATGSTIAYVLSLMVFVAALAVGRGGPAMKLVAILILAALTIVYLVAGGEIEDAFWSWLLDAFQKDPGLTGRSYLWYFADQLIAEHPFVGLGYNAFWTQGNMDAEGLWALNGINDRMGFNFHSTVRDLLVDGGWIGLTGYAASLGVPLLIVGSRVFRDGRVIDACCLTIVFYFICRLPFESWVLAPWSSDTMVLIFCLARLPADWPPLPVRNGPTR